ncbi:MAG: hypothetical protein ACJA2H_001180 [Nitriliruptoraceae bacterium]|jgi:hypothetical protein
MTAPVPHVNDAGAPTLPDGEPLFADAGSDAGVRAGRRLGGRYVLEERLASGGAAAVWRGFDETLSRTIAIKVLHPGLADDADAVARFQHEAIAGARVAHPGVVATLDAGRDEDLEWLALEHVDGPTLLEVMRHHPKGLEPTAAAAIAELAADGLAQAHRAGLIHRDIKPANLMVTREGVVKLADFGVSVLLDGASAPAGAAARRVGTPGYAAPEQLTRGEPADPRADVYALGIVLHECLTGRPAEADGRVLPPRQVRPDVPRDLDAIVTRATARDAADRYVDAGAMALALRQLGGDEPQALARVIARNVLRRTPGAKSRPRGRDAPHAPAEPAIAAAAATQTPRGTQPAEIPMPRHMLRWAAAGLVGLAAIAFLTRVANEPGVVAPSQTVTDIGVPVRDLRLFDPYGSLGSGADNDVHAALDGDASTTWSTPRYPVPLRSLGTPGVGIRLDLGEPISIATLTVLLETPGVSLEVLTRDAAPQAGDTEADWDLVVRRDAPGLRFPLDLAGHTAQHWLVWFTELQATGETWHASVIDLRFDPVTNP